MNPFTHHPKHHFFLVFEHLQVKAIRILDLGFGDGEFLGHLKEKVDSVFGYDVDEARARMVQKKYQFAHIKHGAVDAKLPYKSAFFDAVFLLHVLEHVDDEERVIQEIHRVLKTNGTLYFASPYRGLFAWADMANLRYNFPLAHKLLGRKFYGKEKFTELFEERGRNLYGDSAHERSSHYHYQEKEIKKVLGRQFKIEKFYKYSLFQPFLFSLWNICLLLFGKVPCLIRRLVWLDNRIKAGEWSYNFLVVAKKK